MSTGTINSESDTEYDDVEVQVEAEIGDSPAAAETQPIDALKWYEIVEVPEVGFKAFCRLPNDFQHKDIREKAMAAKARRRRQLKHPETDAYEILEADLDLLSEDGGKEAIITELLTVDSIHDRNQAVLDLTEEEEWEHIRQDQERFRSIVGMAEEDRPEDEFKEVTEHLRQYGEAIQVRMEEIAKPRREALEARDHSDLVDMVRERRIDSDSRRAFMDAYSFWQMLAGTLALPDDFDPENLGKSMPSKRYFTEDGLRGADPTIVSTLTETFERLEGNLASLTSGNS